MSRPICFFVGDLSAINERQLINIGEMLSDRFPLHLVTSSVRDLEFGKPHFRVFGCRSGNLADGVVELRRYLAEETPQVVVQLSDPPVHGTIVAVLGQYYDVPTVYRYAGDRFLEYRVCRGKQRVTAFILGAILGRVPLRLSSKLVALGPTGRRRLIARGASSADITVLPPAVDTNRFTEVDVPSLGYDPDQPVALFVGRLTRLKGRETLETILPQILKQRSELRFVFVGDDDRTISVPPRFNDRIDYVGYVEPEQIPKYMQMADVLIHPSLTEGVPRVVLEALAAGTPVLARDVGDVASATGNTFTTDQEFADLLCDYESLPLDPIQSFSLETLQPKYVSFFDQFY